MPFQHFISILRGFERDVGSGHTNDGPRAKDFFKNLRAVQEDFLAVKFGLGYGFGICAGYGFGVCAGTKPCAKTIWRVLADRRILGDFITSRGLGSVDSPSSDKSPSLRRITLL